MQAEIFTGSNSGLIIGSYVALNLLALFLLDHWLCNCSLKYRDSVTRRVIVCFLYISVASLPVLALFIRDGLYKYYLERYSYVWMGFLMYFGAFILVLSVLELIIRFILRSKRRKQQDEEAETGGTAGRVVSGIALLLIITAAIAINIYGTEHARKTVVTRYNIEIDKPVKKHNALRVAFISDLHLSYNSDIDNVYRMVETINREKPDVVFVGGDMFSSDYGSVMKPKEYIKAFKGIKAKEGVFWVYGNHDVQEPLFCGFSMVDPEKAKRTRKIKRFIKKSGFTTLDDKCTAIAGGEVQVAGRTDMYKPVGKAATRKEPGDLLNDLDKDKPIIVLAHEQGDFDELAENGADILFSGHTHAGQVFPGNIVTGLFNDILYGFAEKNGLKVIVSSGVGCYGPPIRVLTDSEIVIADITFKK